MAAALSPSWALATLIQTLTSYSWRKELPVLQAKTATASGPDPGVALVSVAASSSCATVGPIECQSSVSGLHTVLPQSAMDVVRNLTLSGCVHPNIQHFIRGRYVGHADNHGRSTFMKEQALGSVTAYIYYLDEY